MNKKRLEGLFGKRRFSDEIISEHNAASFTKFISFKLVRRSDVFAETLFGFFSFPKGLS